jgi:hypothetical protein
MSHYTWKRIAWSCVLAVTPCSLFAVDGVVLIDQSHALSGNITPGDTPGFPVTISQPGSYKLSGNLTVADADTTAILITSEFVTLDLNGFSISGPVVCTQFPTTCPAAGKGSGIQANMGFPGPRAIRILNGTVHGMGNFGIVMSGDSTFVEGVSADGNAGGGIEVAGTVVRSGASGNGAFGILAVTVLNSNATENVGDGIILDASGGVGMDNVASFNGGRGILAQNATVTGNAIVRNNGAGISAICPSSISNNMIASNPTSITFTNSEPCSLLNNATRP